MFYVSNFDLEKLAGFYKLPFGWDFYEKRNAKETHQWSMVAI